MRLRIAVPLLLAALALAQTPWTRSAPAADAWKTSETLGNV